MIVAVSQDQETTVARVSGSVLDDVGVGGGVLVCEKVTRAVADCVSVLKLLVGAREPLVVVEILDVLLAVFVGVGGGVAVSVAEINSLGVRRRVRVFVRVTS